MASRGLPHPPPPPTRPSPRAPHLTPYRVGGRAVGVCSPSAASEACCQRVRCGVGVACASSASFESCESLGKMAADASVAAALCPCFMSQGCKGTAGPGVRSFPPGASATPSGADAPERVIPRTSSRRAARCTSHVVQPVGRGRPTLLARSPAGRVQPASSAEAVAPLGVVLDRRQRLVLRCRLGPNAAVRRDGRACGLERRRRCARAALVRRRGARPARRRAPQRRRPHVRR